MTDRYMKVVFTIIALSLIWLGVKRYTARTGGVGAESGLGRAVPRLGRHRAGAGTPESEFSATRLGWVRVCVLLKIVFRDCVCLLWRLRGPSPEFQQRTQLWGQFYRLRSNLL